MQAIADSCEQMEAKFSKLREDMSASQEQATQEVIKTFKQQNEYSFRKKGNHIQYQFNAAVDASLQVAKKLSKLQPTNGQEQAALKRVSDSLEEGIAAISERQKKIKLADRLDYGWEMVATYKKNELAENSDNEKKIKKAEKSGGKSSDKTETLQEGRAEYLPWSGSKCGTCNQGDVGRSSESMEDKSSDGIERLIGPYFNCTGWGHPKKG